jgi:hypothetical protein
MNKNSKKVLSPAARAWAKVKADTAQTVKDRIQTLLRAIALIRDGGCVLAPFQGKNGIPYCNGYRKDGEMIYQYDHLNSRAFNVSYADPRLGVIICKGHHGWKTFTDNNKKLYDALVRKIIGPARSKLWDRVETDRKTYHMGVYEWQKVELGLAAELKKMKGVASLGDEGG